MELIRGFIRENLGILTESPFKSSLYRTKKYQYFLLKHGGSKQGNPRDNEIATETVWFLIKRGQVKTKEALEKVLSSGLPAEKCLASDIFYEFLEANKIPESILDYRKLREADFLESIREEIRNQLRREMSIQGIFLDEKEIQKRLADYVALPSVIDAKEFPEPTRAPEEVDNEENKEWWELLHLTEDPFKATEGLFKVRPETYDSVVVKTPMFRKYIRYIETTPDEIFKNTIFFGEFGSGKTTLFQYLRKALEMHGIYSVYVHLFLEMKDFQSLKIVFKEKLMSELKTLLGEDEAPTIETESRNIDTTLITYLNVLNKKLKPKGLVVFIDDMNKKREDYALALEFLNYLQVFTYELADKITIPNIGFYIAGALEWEPIVRNQAKYSGSLARPETIPDVTEEEAWEMLNKRLEAYYPNPEVRREVDRNFVSAVYRDLKTNNIELTFRRFIQRLSKEFKANNFNVLVSDPVHIPAETIRKIKLLFDFDLILKERFRTLLEEKLKSQENRIVCIRLLLDIFLREKSAKRLKDSDLGVDYLFYLRQLATAGLISKVPEGKDDHTWAVCKELREKSLETSQQFSLSLENYLLKIYGIGQARRRGSNEEIQQIKNLSEKCDDQSRKPLENVLALHVQIIDAMDTYSLPMTEAELMSKCAESLSALTQFFVDHVEGAEGSGGYEPDLTYWNNFWFFPDELAEFQNLLSDLDRKRTIWHALGIYRDAFNVLFSFIKKEHKSLSSIHISSFGLDNEDAKQLIAARDFWADGFDDKAARFLYNHIQAKMRVFVQNILTLIYGDLPNRMRHVDEKTKQKIMSAISSRRTASGVAFRETNSMTFEDLVELVTNAREVGSANCWKNVFSKLFYPNTAADLEAYSDKLGKLKIQYPGEVQSDPAESQVLREIILTTVELTRSMNASYSLLLKSLYLEGEFPVVSMYLSLDGLQDKTDLIGTSFQAGLYQSLTNSMSSGIILLDDEEFNRDYYSMPYRSFFIFLALILDEAKLQSLGLAKKFSLEKIKGSSISVKKVFNFSMQDLPRISLAHSGKDGPFVKKLSGDLQRYNVKVWEDDFDLKGGNPITQTVHDALRERDCLGIVLSRGAAESEFLTEDLTIPTIKELDNKGIATIPILLQECTIPPAIGDKRNIDFVRDYDHGLEQLLNRLEETRYKESARQMGESIEERIANRENSKIERKSAFKFDLKTRMTSKVLEKAISKAVAAFMNADGGELFIGVEDDGNLVGLSGDLSLVMKANIDGFERELRQSLEKHLKDSIIWELIDIGFPTVKELQVCHVIVYPSSRPIIVHDEGREEFYVRIGNMSRPYSFEEFHDYWKRRFTQGGLL